MRVGARPIDGHGKVLALAAQYDGEAIVMGEIRPGQVEASDQSDVACRSGSL